MTTVTDQPPPEQVAKTVQVTARAKNCASGYNDLAEFLSDHPHLAEQIDDFKDPTRFSLYVTQRQVLAEWVTAARAFEADVAPYVEDGSFAGVNICFGPAFIQLYGPKTLLCERREANPQPSFEWRLVLPGEGGAE